MFYYLNPPRSFWQIPDSDLSLSSSNPAKNFTDEEINALDADQRAIFDKAVQYQVISQVTEDFARKTASDPMEAILCFSAQEIQRRYVSAFSKVKDITSLEQLLELENKKDTPRTSVVQLLTLAISRIKEDDPVQGYYKAIEVIEDVIEETEAAVPQVQPQIQPKKRGRNKPSVTENA